MLVTQAFHHIGTDPAVGIIFTDATRRTIIILGVGILLGGVRLLIFLSELLDRWKFTKKMREARNSE